MRILSLDVGNSSIKAVEMDSAFGRYEIHDYHECPIPPEKTAPEVILTLVKGLARTPDKVIVSLSGAQFTFRNLQLPTRDKRAIQSSVGFELEDELPFSAEKSVNEFVIISQTKMGSQVHVAATLKQQILSTLEFWNTTGVEIDLITTEAWAYRTLLNRVLSPAEQDGPTLLVQMGHRRSTFYLQWHGNPVLIREFPCGGQDITLALSKKFNIPLEQAEAMKLERGILITTGALSEAQPETITEVTPEQKEISDCIKDALDPFLTELRHVHLTSRDFSRKSMIKIYLAGGTSLVPGMAKWIESNFRIPTQSLHALSATAASGVTYSEETDARFLLSAALAFCMVGPARSTLVNFRRGEFAKAVKTRQLDMQALRKPLYALASIGVSLFLSLWIQSTVYKSRLQTVDAQLERSVKAFFGQVSASALRGYLADTPKLKASVFKELNKQRELARLFGPNLNSPLGFLNQLSLTIPKDLTTDLVKFQVGTPTGDSYLKTDSKAAVSLNFIVGTPQIADRLTSTLGRKIDSLQAGKPEEYTDPKTATKKWKISYNGKPVEDSYGK